jgi:hypothetical protein
MVKGAPPEEAPTPVGLTQRSGFHEAAEAEQRREAEKKIDAQKAAKDRARRRGPQESEDVAERATTKPATRAVTAVAARDRLTGAKPARKARKATRAAKDAGSIIVKVVSRDRQKVSNIVTIDVSDR